jgi:hypothetical protein
LWDTLYKFNKHLDNSAEAHQYQLSFSACLIAKTPHWNWYLSIGMRKNQSCQIFWTLQKNSGFSKFFWNLSGFWIFSGFPIFSILNTFHSPTDIQQNFSMVGRKFSGQLSSIFSFILVLCIFSIFSYGLGHGSKTNE